MECSLQSDGENRPPEPIANPFKKLFLSTPFFTIAQCTYPQKATIDNQIC